MHESFPPVIRRYLTEVLVPELRGIGVPAAAANIVALDIGVRLWSILARWKDAAFRKTMLLLALEEATFYEPRSAPLEIGALIVLTVRDSLLEDLNATDASHPDLAAHARRITDDRMPEVTRKAVEFFTREQRHAIAGFPPPSAEDDVFGGLAARYPRAWSALSTLAAMTGAETAYEVAGKEAAIPVLPKPPKGHRGGLSVVNGITTGIDSGLAAALAERWGSGGSCSSRTRSRW